MAMFDVSRFIRHSLTIYFSSVIQSSIINHILFANMKNYIQQFC